MKVLSAFVTILAVAAARVAVTHSTWTLQELEAALYDPTTPPALKPYLIDALNNLMQQLFDGGVHTSIPVITPAGVLPSPSEIAAVAEGPNPAGVVAPIVPAEVVAPVAPVAESAAPLVQIIINVNAEQQQAISPNPVVVSPVPEVAPTPVIIVEQPEIIEAPTPVEVIDVPTPVNPIDVIAITPPEVNPVDVIDVANPINPIDVIAITPPELNPIDVIAITPPELNPIDVIAITPPEINPIDVIAIAAPDVNPIDVMAPLPAISGGNDGGILV